MSTEQMYTFCNECENSVQLYLLSGRRCAAHSSSLNSSLVLLPLAPLLPEMFITDQPTEKRFLCEAAAVGNVVNIRSDLMQL